MAEYMGIPYIEVAAKAIIPALLYFTGIFLAVHLEAKKLQLKGIPRKELPKWSYLAKNCYLVIPLVLLVWLVASGARTMAVSAAISIVGAFIIGFINFFVTGVKERSEDQTVGSVFIDSLKVALATGLRRAHRRCTQLRLRGCRLRHGRSHRRLHHRHGPRGHAHQRHRQFRR